MRTKLLRRASLLLAIIAFLSFAIYSCTEPLNNTNSNNNNNIGQTGSVTGKVFTTGNKTISGAIVSVGNVVTYSNEWGEYMLTGVPVGNHVVVTFKFNNYTTTFKVVTVKSKTTSFTDAALIPVGTTQNVNAGNACSVQFNGAKVDIPANAMVDSKGNIFSGNAKVVATYFDPTNSQFLNCFPGEFKGTRKDNTETMIESFGYISVELFNGTDKLQLATGKQATITIPIPAKLQAKAPQSIPLWYFDESQGKWMEQGSATKTGNIYIGTVSHFTNWNADYPGETSYLQGKVVDSTGTAIPCAVIWASGSDYIGYSNCSTSDDGTFKIPVKANSNVSLFAQYYNYVSPTNSCQTPDPGASSDIGTLTINLGQLNVVIITGRLIDNGNNPLAGVYLKLFDSLGNLVNLIYNSSLDGRFKLYGQINKSYIITQWNYWLDTTKPRQSWPITTGSQYGLQDVGDLKVDIGGSTINGTVVNSNGIPMQNVDVYSSESAYNFWGQKAMATGADGKFSLWCRPNLTVNIKLYQSGNSKYLTPTSPPLGQTLDLGNVTFP